MTRHDLIRQIRGQIDRLEAFSGRFGVPGDEICYFLTCPFQDLENSAKVISNLPKKWVILTHFWSVNHNFRAENRLGRSHTDQVSMEWVNQDEPRAYLGLHDSKNYPWAWRNAQNLPNLQFFSGTGDFWPSRPGFIATLTNNVSRVIRSDISAQ